MRGRIRRILMLSMLVLVLAVPLLSSACGGGSSGEITYTVADTGGDWGYPSPYAHYPRGPGYVRMSFIFDTLVWKDEAGFIPALAESWEYIASENAYVFNLRDDVTWHDGTDFTAEDVAFTVDYVKEHPSPFVTLIGATGITSTEVIDTYTVKLYLEQPYAPFLNDVAVTMTILPKHIWEGVEAPEEYTGPEAVIGTGPYKLADYNQAQGSYLYEAYDDYYLGKPAVDRIIFVKVSEQMILAALEQGSVNAGAIPPELVEEMEDSGFSVLRCTYGWNAKLMINHTEEPLSSEEFRQALAYAIDREAMVDISQRGYALAGSPGMMPPDSEWYNPDIEMYEHNPAKAQQLLEGLGYQLEDGHFTKDGEELKLELITEATFKEAGQFVEQQLEDFGIEVDFTTLEGTTIDARVLNWQFDLAIYGHGGLYEPSILPKVITEEGFNSARYTENETLNQLLEDQLHEMDHEERLELVYQIQEIYADELPALSLYYPDWYWAHDGSVNMYYTQGGIATGIPVATNKMAFLEYQGQ